MKQMFLCLEALTLCLTFSSCSHQSCKNLMLFFYDFLQIVILFYNKGFFFGKAVSFPEPPDYPVVFFIQKTPFLYEQKGSLIFYNSKNNKQLFIKCIRKSDASKKGALKAA